MYIIHSILGIQWVHQHIICLNKQLHAFYLHVLACFGRVGEPEYIKQCINGKWLSTVEISSE